MFRAGGSGGGGGGLKPTGRCGVRANSSHYRAPDQALPFAPPNAVKVPSPGWKKQQALMQMSKTLKSVSSNLLERFIDTAYRFSEQPSLNEGNFRPVNEISEAVLLSHLSGEVPEDFPEGVYIRNGPNPLHPTQTIADSIFGSTSYMYYEGHGMLHAVYFNKSSLGEWKISYRNKYVDSDTFQLERGKNEVAFVPSADGQPYATLVAFVLNILRFGKAVKDSANTNIFEHAGRAFAITENHLPYEIDINNLNTLGPYNINGAWDQPFTSHPKDILAKAVSELHMNNLLFLFIENDMDGKSRIGVMPRFGDAESIIWFDVENHCSYHLFNCFEDGNEVVVRGCRILGSIIPSDRHRVDKLKWYGRAFLQPDTDSGDFDPSLDGILFSRPYEWRLNMQSGATNEGYITSEKVAMDFAVINDKFIGIRNKYGYAQVVDSLATSKTGLFKFKKIAKLHFDMPDKENKQFISVEYHTLQEKQYCSGVQFVAKENGIDEDDGWIVTYVHDEGTNISQVYIIDAKRFSEEPVAKITLPRRVPYGFHGNFFYK
ncbi:Carotenoid 9,10(9',10')-cleavage dioxygenase 1 [Dichanthelium oligosanthes]|uniref:Carotenoid 9,10(9',10')-cleavage dioxygenase 1 n=1 Tax=Dichanthelium oligosanthes TaxID=888268 RepID=A0A1E5W6A0_9POAL|nr:Carotenoid 9,10(9',10')-cleavage dioxygenase 1 [Dichanthelium oligosanthes]